MADLVGRTRVASDPRGFGTLWLAWAAMLAAAGIAVAVAQLSLKALVVLAGAAALAGALVLVRDRPLAVLSMLAASIQFMFHKSFGPIAREVSGGAQSIYITSLDVFLVVLYGLWLAEGTLWRELRSALSVPGFLLPLIAIALTIPSLLVASDLALALGELVRMAWMYLLFLYVALRVRDRRTLGFVIAALCVLAVVQSALVTAQWRTGSSLGLGFLGEESELGLRTLDDGEIPRPTGTATHADFLAAMVAPIGLLALSLAINLRHRGHQLMALAVAGAAFAPLAISQTRAAAVGSGVAIVVICAVSLARGRLSWRALIGALSVAAVAAVVAWDEIQRRIIDNLGTEQFAKEVASRVELNDLALTIARDHPVLGVGLNNFEQVLGRYDVYGLIFFDHPVHNLYLLVLSEAGIIGLAGLALMAVVSIGVAVQLAAVADRLLSAVGIGVLGALMFFGLEELLTFALRHDMPLAVLWLLLGLTVACLRMADEPAPPQAVDP